MTVVCNAKRVGHRVKQSEIWDSGVIVISMWGSFDLLVLGQFEKHSVQLSQKRLQLVSCIGLCERMAHLNFNMIVKQLVTDQYL